MNRKYFLLTILSILLLRGISFSQEELVTEWELRLSSDLPNGNAEAWAIGSDQDGNLLWGVNKDMAGFFEFMNALVYKLDDESNLIWIDTAATGAFAQQSYNLKVTDSLVYLGGRTCRALGIDSCDMLLVTTDVNNGETDLTFVWDAGYGYEEIDGIAIEADGIILTGWSAGDGTEIDVILMKIGFDGNVIWQTRWGGMSAKDDHQDGHIVVDDSMIYVSGLYDGSPSLGWDGRALLAKFDKTDGTFVDSVTYGRQDQWFNAENALGMASDGTYLYTTGYTTTSANNWDIFVAKFDKDLNNIWHTTWGGLDTESARAITVADDGSIYIGGNTDSFGNGKIDMALLKFNPAGTLEWYKTWGDLQDDQILDIYLDDHNLYLTGKTQSFHPTQKWEAILLQVDLDKIVSNTEIINDQPPVLHFFPNPMTNSALLKLDPSIVRPQKLSIFNAMGQEVMTVNNISDREISVEKKNIGSGIFFFQLLYDDQKNAVGKLIIN